MLGGDEPSPNTPPMRKLSRSELLWLAEELPAPCAETGRPAIPNLELLPGILRVLQTGITWESLSETRTPYSPATHWRRLRFWEEHKSLEEVWRQLVPRVPKGHINGFADGSLFPSAHFSDLVSYSGKHHRNGTKLTLVTNQEGLPLSDHLTPGSVHDIPALEEHLQRATLRLATLTTDKGYDSASLRHQIKEQHIRPNLPERTFKKRRKLGRPQIFNEVLGKLRFAIERTFSWIKQFKRIKARLECTAVSFSAFLHLSYICMWLRSGKSTFQGEF